MKAATASYALLLVFFVSASEGSVGLSDIPRTPSRQYLESKALKPKPPGTARVMHLYEVALITGLCDKGQSRPEFAGNRKQCLRSMFAVRNECTTAFQHRLPRPDNRVEGERLDHRSFASGYLDCLRARYESRRVRN